MIETAILIPFRDSCPDRLSNLVCVIKYLNRFIPKAKIVIIEQNTITDLSYLDNMIYRHIHSVLTEDLFCRGFLLNEGYNAIPAKYYILCDGDVLVDSWVLKNFSELFEQLKDTFILPYELVFAFNVVATNNLKRKVQEPVDLTLNSDRTYAAVGGVGFISGENFFKNGGYSEGYIGWGGEDDNFYNKIVVGTQGIKISRIDRPLVHLWHPSQMGHSYTAEQIIQKRIDMPKLILRNHEEN